MDEEISLPNGTPFNMAVATLQRIDNLLKDINDHSRAGFFTVWMQDLNALYKETIPFVEITEDKTKLDVLKKRLLDAYKKFKIEIIRNNIKPKSDNYNDENLHEFFDRVLSFKHPFLNEFIENLDAMLDEFEIALRMLLKKYHLLMPSKSDPKFALGRGHYG